MTRFVSDRPVRHHRRRARTNALGSYLTDHLAGADAACLLLERLAAEHAEDHLGGFFSDLLRDVRADREILEHLVRAVQGHTAPIKRSAGRFAGKLSRLKLGSSNGSPLALFESLEVLSLGILGKLALWLALSTVTDAVPHVATVDLAGLERRAADQHARVERQRLIAAPLALV